MSSNDTYHNYKKYSLEKLEEWIHNAIDQEDITPHEIYECVRNSAVESFQHHRKHYIRMSQLISLLDGDYKGNLEDVMKEREYYEGWDTTATGEKFPRVCDKDDPSPECKKSWVDFWEETYYPEEHKKEQYTEEELDAMCEAAASQQEKDKCREYNLREAEYYNKRAQLDAEYNKMQEQVSRNDPNRLKYEEGWVYESTDRGKTVTRRRVGSLEKEIVKADGYSTSEKKTWTLPVEESNIDGVKDYYVTFPDDLLKAADLKEGDTVEWIDRKDGSFELRKSLSCPPCPPCDTLSCADHLADD